ncbi:hypothetical protein GOBAR_DD16340 [Gossypium barbadense]|nr:hypothetical protein GOBAR_DD16340 [Gossypium barbadense]
MTELNHKEEIEEFGSWMVVSHQSRRPIRRNAKIETNQQKMNYGSRFSLIVDLNEESGDGTTGNMDGNSSITINAIMPKLGFSLGEASGSSLSGSKNKGKALQGFGLRKKGLNGVKFGSSGPQQKSVQVKEVVVVEENWDPNIMVVKGKKMSNKLGCSFWRKKVDAMMSLGDLVENISEKIDSAIRNIEVPREDGMELLETKSEEGNF